MCGKVFQYPSRLAKHLNNKFPCKAKQSAGAIISVAPIHGCPQCGKQYSSVQAVYRHRREACDLSKTGIDSASIETVKREIVEELRAELRSQMQLGAPQIVQNGAVQNNIGLVQHNTINVTMHVFGQEDTSHITKDTVKRVLDESLSDSDTAVEQALGALVRAAMLVYSDPEHPENITCYIPNKKQDSRAMVRDRTGWSLWPCRVVYPRMATTVVDLLFQKQPFEDAERYGELMRALRDSETAYSNGHRLAPIVVSNKELLRRVLGTLPQSGIAA